MGHLFERLQRLYGPEAALGFRTRAFGVESLTHELLRAEFDVKRDFGIHVPPADIAAAEHQVEEPANAGSNERHSISAPAR